MTLKELLVKMVGGFFIIKDKFGDIVFDTRTADLDADEVALAIKKYGDRKIRGIDAETYEINNRCEMAFQIFYID